MEQRFASNILWHFTGSPENIDWSGITSPTEILERGKPKTNSKSFSILKKIIESKKLIASCKEKIAPTIETKQFCCVTDIPLKDLKIHCNVYGNFAIGFNSSAIYKAFNPVLYITEEWLPKKIAWSEELKKVIYEPGIIPEEYLKDSYIHKLSDGRVEIEAQELEIVPDTEKIKMSLIDHFKVTKFSEKINKSFYYEREWRKIGDFIFDRKDVAAIIVPGGYIGRLAQELTKLEYTTIPILTWEIITKA